MLIGIRRIGTTDAFDEVIGTARRNGVSVFAPAEALVALAGGDKPPDPALARAARTKWGTLVRPQTGHRGVKGYALTDFGDRVDGYSAGTTTRWYRNTQRSGGRTTSRGDR